MRANVLCFDAETAPADDPAALAFLERTCPKNKKLETHIADSGKNPMVARLLCVSIKMPDVEYSFDMMRRPVSDELKRFSEVVNEHIDAQTVFTGYNIKMFDLHLMLMQFQRAGVTPPVDWPMWTGKYWRGRIHDSMERTPCPGKNPKMSEVCEMYGIPGKTFTHNGRIITGADVASLYDAGEYQTIIDYCEADVSAEYDLYLRQTFNGSWGAYDDDRAELKSILAELSGNEQMSNSVKWLTAIPILKAARLLV